MLVHYDIRLSEFKQGDARHPVTLPNVLTQIGTARPFIDPATCWILDTELTLPEAYNRLIDAIGREDRLFLLALDDDTTWLADPQTTHEATEILRTRATNAP